MRYPEYPGSQTTLEESILQRWRDEGLFERVQAATAEGEPFVFYEGPPTANGRPGIHHVFARTLKDLVCRYRTMTGRRVVRKAGWDTHGLPVEIEAEKGLGISGKREIEALGVARFNEVCREGVFRYKEDWERLSERIGYWLDYSDPYVTFHAAYVESVWWLLSRLAEEDLLYRGYRSVPYCPRCGTALSSHEVAQGYREVEDPSVHFLCPLLDDAGGEEDRALLAWTTTPWTIPSNVGLAIDPALTYAEVEHGGRGLILAEALVEAVFGADADVRRRIPGSALVGRRYRRPLELVPVTEAEAAAAWRVIPADFVSAAEGTGIVHIAPAFGSDDYAAGQEHGLPMLRPVDDAGRFRDDVAEVAGRFVKDADDALLDLLEEAGLLFRRGRALHSYPHCWRCESPLIYMARDSWYIRTTAVKDRMLANNGAVSWHPPEIGTGRFGEWLEGNVDWALSRDRYWGTPLPAWVCDRDPSHLEVIGSFAALAERVGGLPADFDPHKPFIDEYVWPCPSCDGTMRRTPEVIDAWFDSGAMPWAQWHYPFENRDRFEDQFPADFIAEGLDQTRGWFYSLMAIATMLGHGPVYRNVLVNGLLLDRDGQKMSKSRGNVVDPWTAIERFGADGIRWYLVTVSHPWAGKRWDEDALGEAVRRTFDTLANTYRFFALYANLEDWSPDGTAPGGAAPVMDRWLRSRLARLVAEAGGAYDAYDLTRAARAIGEFVVDDLSNWYVRRGRDRFWGSADAADTAHAFATLHLALVTVARLAAPVIPFLSDWLHRALTGETVHLARFPAPDDGERDASLEAGMSAVRTLSSLGRAARESVRIRVRQPLGVLHAVTPGATELAPQLLDVLRDEINVKEVRFLADAGELVSLEAKPDFRSLGQRFGSRTQEAAAAIRALGGASLGAFVRGEPVAIEVAGSTHALQPGDLEVVQVARGDLAIESGDGFTVALDPSIDEALRLEGVARELVNRVQRLRRDAGLEVSDRIRLWIDGDEDARAAAARHRDYIAGEVLALGLEVEPAPAGGGAHVREVDLDGTTARIAIEVAATAP